MYTNDKGDYDYGIYDGGELNMTVVETINYCYAHKDEYIKTQFKSVSEGMRAFDILICLVEDEVITYEQLEDYGI